MKSDSRCPSFARCASCVAISRASGEYEVSRVEKLRTSLAHIDYGHLFDQRLVRRLVNVRKQVAALGGRCGWGGGASMRRVDIGEGSDISSPLRRSNHPREIHGRP